MREAHRFIGAALVAGLAGSAAVAAIAAFGKRTPDRLLRGALVVLLALAALQAAAGAWMVASGARPSLMHYVYAAAVAAVLGAGWAVGRAVDRDRWVVYGLAAGAGLLVALRAFLTGTA